MARLEELDAFCKVVEQKSFSRAARQLNLSQPAVSIQIKSLEAEYGTELLYRDGPEILPTESGSMVYEFAKQIMDLYEKSLQNVNQLKKVSLSGSLRIGASTGPGEYLLPLLIGKYKQEFPDVKVSLHVGSSSEVVNQILKYQIELGFVGVSLRDKYLNSETFIQDKLVLIAAADHPLAQRRNIQAEELKNIPLILQQQGSGATQSLEEELLRLGVPMNDLNVVMELGLQESTKRAVQAGYGLTFISRFGVVDELRHGDLVEILLDGKELKRDLNIVYRRSAPLSNVANHFIEFARREVGRISGNR